MFAAHQMAGGFFFGAAASLAPVGLMALLPILATAFRASLLRPQQEPHLSFVAEA
jgi:hypothetical protein